jgi:integrase
MATIETRTKDGKPVYRVKIRRKGSATQFATFARLTDARKWAQMTEAAIDEGRHFKTTEAKRHTLAEMVDRYIQDVLPGKSASSVYMQTQQLGWWKAQLGTSVLADITPNLLAEYRDKLARGDGKRRSNATVLRYMAALSHAFTIAVKEWRWLDESPMRNVSKPKESRGRVRFLSDEERERLLDACKQSDNPYLYPVVALALSTGARKMEILTLRWPDIDVHRQVITLHNTKNGERRALPLAGHALALVQHCATMRRGDSPYVFPSRNGKKPFDIRRAWEAALRKADIPDFTFHDLRHSAASYLAMNGASLAEIADILGHKTLSMVKRYAHLSEAHTAGVVARMNAQIFGEAR